MTINELSEKLLNYRVVNKLTQAEAGKELGVTNRTIMNIEKGKDTVRKITLQKVALKLEEKMNGK